MKRKIAAIFAADAVRGRNLRDAANQEEAPAPTSANAAPPPAPPPTPSGEKFAPETVPFVPDRARTILANEYVPAADYKALALNANGVNIFVTGEQNEEAAKTAAIDQCQKPRTLRGRRENASFTPAATWWSTRTADHRRRHCPGSSTIATSSRSARLRSDRTEPPRERAGGYEMTVLCRLGDSIRLPLVAKINRAQDRQSQRGLSAWVIRQVETGG
jgi:hypothetical protein